MIQPSRIHRLFLCKKVRPRLQRVSWIYDIKQSGGEVPVMLELYRKWIIASLPLFLDSFWPGVIAPNRVLSMGLIELFDIQTLSRQMTYA